MSHTSSILRAWAPLAASWLLMAAEMPFIAAVLARMQEPEMQLAAFGGVALPVALVIESPIIMMLAASAELCRSEASYRSLRRFTHRAGFLLTLLHLILAATPLFDVLAVYLLDLSPELIEPARIGFLLMTPWTWAIAGRRFNQGILVRYGESKVVTQGTIVRLLAGASVLFSGFHFWADSGVVLAGLTMSTGVIAEALYVSIRVRPTLRRNLLGVESSQAPLQGKAFLEFYLPLALTPMITLLARPICAAGISRMPEELNSLAVWPVVGSVTFILGAVGLSFTEVVVTRYEEESMRKPLWHITLGATGVVGSIALLFLTTGLGEWWLEGVSGLSQELSQLAMAGLYFGAFGPVLLIIQSWYQGILVYSRKTRPITESVALFLLTCSSVLAVGIVAGGWSGAIVAMVGISIGRIVQSIWLRHRVISSNLLSS